ncbi:MAG: hypothetical protein IJS93_02360 [Clostridia bacterium]|nr:hypothetical protein [Clostridia bacterium]
MKKTEITVEVFDNANKIREILVDRGFVLIKSFMLEDEYFSRIDLETLKGLPYADILASSFLLRRESPADIAEIIYKDKTVNDKGLVLEEEKTTIIIDDIDKAKALFTRAGLNNWCSLRNNSEVYKKGDIEFAVQFVDELGVFIEFEENDSMKGLSPEEKLRSLYEELSMLGLTLGKDYSVKKPYLKLLKTI